MSDPDDTYFPQTMNRRFRRQAYLVWLISACAVLLWTAVIVAAPIAKLNGFTNFASAVYGFFSYICHQISNRSFHIDGEPFAVCSRCFGVYAGLLAGFLIYPLWRNIEDIEPLPRIWLFLSLIPMAVDWSLGFFGIWENTHLSRLITGLILGLACATFIIPALIEVTRNTLYSRQMKKAA